MVALDVSPKITLHVVDAVDGKTPANLTGKGGLQI